MIYMEGGNGGHERPVTVPTPLTPEQKAAREQRRAARPPENTIMADQIRKVRAKLFPDAKDV